MGQSATMNTLPFDSIIGVLNGQICFKLVTGLFWKGLVPFVCITTGSQYLMGHLLLLYANIIFYLEAKTYLVYINILPVYTMIGNSK